MKNFKIGLQLFSIRGDMEKDMETALKKVKEMGYDCVEFAGYFGRSAEEVRAMLDSIGLECISVHQRHEVFLKDEEANIAYLKTIGARYCALPTIPRTAHAENDCFRQTVSDLVQVGKALKDNGIQMLYHNHDFEFNRFEGKYLLDWLYDSVPEELLQTELDTCWVRYAGEDPVSYLKKYTGRSPVVHLKDFVCREMNAGVVYALIDSAGKAKQPLSRAENGFKFVPLGMGLQDFAPILEAAEAAGAECLIVEQDESPVITPMESAQISRRYLASLGL